MGELVPGAYTFTQALLLTGWSLTAITCDSGDWEATLFNNTVIVYLDPRDNIYCTFMNQKDSLGQPTPTPTSTPPTATPSPSPTAEIFSTPQATATLCRPVATVLVISNGIIQPSMHNLSTCS